MSNLLDDFELAGLRESFDNMLGQFDEGGDDPSITRAKTLGTITRTYSSQTLNETTGKYEGGSSEIIYSGVAHMSPVTYRRDRQELGGQEAVRIRQYRLVLPWDSGDIHIDDLWTVNFSADPELVGRSFDVSDVMYESEVAARRITLSDTSRNDPDASC